MKALATLFCSYMDLTVSICPANKRSAITLKYELYFWNDETTQNERRSFSRGVQRQMISGDLSVAQEITKPFLERDEE